MTFDQYLNHYLVKDKILYFEGIALILILFIPNPNRCSN